MARFSIMEEHGAWLWRLLGDQGAIAQGMMYADRTAAEADLRLLHEAVDVPAVFAVAPGRWSWAIAHGGRRYGTAARTFASREAAHEACVDAIMAWLAARPRA